MSSKQPMLAVALLAASMAAYAGAVYLDCYCDPELPARFASYGDCVEARSRHNRDKHGGVPVASCRRDLR